MTSNQQRGAITLLLVSILLVGVLIVSLGSFKTTYYQIKRAQNEVQARKEHWQAEGGLECTFSYLRETGKQVSDIVGPSSQPSEFIDWCSPYDQQPKITTRNGTVSGSHVVEAALDRYRVTKSLRDSSLLGAGAIQSTGPIEVIGTLTLQPTAKETPINGNEYECISISFGDLFTYQYDSTHGDSGQALGLEVKDPSVDGPFLALMVFVTPTTKLKSLKVRQAQPIQSMRLIIIKKPTQPRLRKTSIQTRLLTHSTRSLANQKQSRTFSNSRKIRTSLGKFNYSTQSTAAVKS